ncbi:uncharacterized protein LOC113315571 [Papaver somniferum]|uniref:uncharacterized protein LOC113315571 n=1 Tax=Papaver somniferum TaxID=3469 RepID=UPI000E6FF6E6|nr:uncharacterized protein LOC113315571 [Papaver somniferum]
MGRKMPTRCSLCKKDNETLSHIIWQCRFTRHIWAWATGIFNLQLVEDLVVSYKVVKGKSRTIKDMWIVTNLAVTTELWKLRNKAFFEGATVNWLGFKGRVYQIIRDNSIRIKGHMFNKLENLRILSYLKVQRRSSKNSTPVEISWSPPEHGEIMICCDGAALGNPGQAGASFSFKDANSRVLGALCVGLGWQTNFYDEVYREANFTAYNLDKEACLLAEDIYEFYEGRPMCIPVVKWPGEVYYHFK